MSRAGYGDVCEGQDQWIASAKTLSKMAGIIRRILSYFAPSELPVEGMRLERGGVRVFTWNLTTSTRILYIVRVDLSLGKREQEPRSRSFLERRRALCK